MYVLRLRKWSALLEFIFGNGFLGIDRAVPWLLLKPIRKLLPAATGFRKSVATNKATKGSLSSVYLLAVCAPQQYAFTKSSLLVVGPQQYVLPSCMCMYPRSKSYNN